MTPEQYKALRDPLIEVLGRERDAYEQRTIRIRAELVRLQELFYTSASVYLARNIEAAQDEHIWRGPRYPLPEPEQSEPELRHPSNFRRPK